MKINLAARARDEVDAATQRIETDRRGSGYRFELQCYAAMQAAARRPAFYPFADDAPDGDVEVREIYLTRYKYRILYVVRPDEILIVAVAHASRAPGYWHARLPDDD